MIFSKFFKPTWQHKDSAVRIEAINNELSLKVDEHYNVLMELAKNDESELVRRSALLKINSLSVWYEASQSNSMNAVKAFSEKQVEKVLLGHHDIRLTTKDKKQFINEKLKASLLENWLKAETDADVVVALYHRVNKPQLLHSVFKQHQDEAVQLALIEHCTTSEGLDKLLKVAVNPAVKQTIENILNKEKELQEKPLKVTKAAQLVLSKYLALKDAKDYQLALENKSQLIEEWRTLTNEFSCLSDEQRDTLLNRFQEIENTVQKVLAPQAEAYEQEKIAQELTLKRQETLSSFKKQQKEIDQKITQAIFDTNTVDETSTNQEIDNLIEQVQASVIHNKDKTDLVNKLTSIRQKLNKLPQVAEAVSSATHLISKMSQVSFPETIEQLDEKEGDYKRWKNDWREVNKAASGVLPESIHNAYLEIKNNWDKALAPLIQEQKKQFHITQRKIKDVARLINSGKYNAAFGVFKKANTLYENLSDIQKNKLQREFQTVSEKIADLSDWEHYIATPRKQEILTQITELAESPLTDPNQQASKVKSFRKLWNTLGHADDDIERDLNEQFNSLSEKAFAPCRLYYAEQEKLRESHLVERQKTLAEAQTLAALPIDENLDWKQYESQFNRLKQKWRDAGEVDRVAYRELNRAFKSAIETVKQAIDVKHQQSIDAKKLLIAQANELLQAEDLSYAVNEVKALQSKWKALGYSGPKHENSLWKEFRKINDEIFAKRSEEFVANKQLAQQVEESYQEKIKDITKELKNNELESVLVVTRNLKDLEKQVDVNDKNNRVIEKLFRNEFSKLEKLEQNLKAKALTENWKLVFDALHFGAENDIANFKQFNDISSVWQKRLLDNQAKAVGDLQKRIDKTLALEILAGKESPKAQQDRRLALQLEMMQEQMNSGRLNSLEQGLNEWLTIGKINVQDIPLIDRAQAIFTN
ncbi:DUF349 domain-containing protein [Thalassotalea marina]|uniref:DUF349 domain-containing protein n=1 Tax=Thalassotalea marina TaxID=1673741 RepID=A0A919EJK4_9GAMM|nr:DUF349 domain-containing protein [Thalassotalea marina]GHF91720.1 hypothetical protein GCM10017161_19510 [Thalassotalea marina]